MKIDHNLHAASLRPAIERFFDRAAEKILRLARDWKADQGSPVFTVHGRYTTRGWTEWTQGFQFGCQLLQFDATGDLRFLELGRDNTLRHMAPHLSHIGVHDHGFNNVSTYGNLRRLILEGRVEGGGEALALHELALKVSGAVQAARWTPLSDDTGFIHSFNGPHSLFSDTIRSCRSLVLADALGHALMGENDRKFSLLARAMQHIRATLVYNVYYGKGRDAYDVRGRVAHEGIFNTKDGNYRCPSTQQGYSPFSTWTRGLAWVLLGCAEQLEFFSSLPEEHYRPYDPEGDFLKRLQDAALATADFFIENSAADGIPFWDTGAPGLLELANYREEASTPDNPHEPVDSSAAAIAAQGLLRLGQHLGPKRRGKPYHEAGLTVARTLFGPQYQSPDPKHHGLLLHSVYHRPNGWDYIPKGKQVPHGESSMWGDYHAMELAVYLLRAIEGNRPYLTFFGPLH